MPREGPRLSFLRPVGPSGTDDIDELAERDRRGARRVGPSHVAVGVAAVVTVVLLGALAWTKLGPGSSAAEPEHATDVYTVRTGDTVASVAALHAVTPDALTAANDLAADATLTAGQRLTVPLPHPTGSLPSGLAGDDDLLALRPTFEQWADEYGVPVALLEADAWQESGWDNDAVSSDGAIGIGQLLPSTVDYINQTLLDGADLDPHDPSDNIELSAAYFDYLLTNADESWAAALAGYFEGPTAAADGEWDQATTGYVTDAMTLVADFLPAD